MWWPWREPFEQRSVAYSIGDPATAELLGLGIPTVLAGVAVNETSALGLSAVYRAVSLISGTIASLPMRTLTTRGDTTQRVGSFLDSPGGPGLDALTAFEWVELVMVSLLLHGNAYLGHIYGGANQLVGLVPIHPWAVSIDVEPDGTKVFTVSLNDGTVREFTSADLTHIPALSTDGIKGLSPIAVARNSFGISIAGERAAARMFGNGAMVSGIVTPEDDLTAEEAKAIKTDLRNRIQGQENAGDIAVINRKLKFQQWSLSAEDAQFLQSRQFQVEEVARWFGLMPIHLAQTEKQTSWGSGVAEQNRGLARYVLMAWTTRIEERLTRLLTGGKKVEFDYLAFTQPEPETLVPLLISQVASGLLTTDEARKILNLPPLTAAQKAEIAAAQGLPSPSLPSLNGNGQNGNLVASLS